jgi:hypothetical protein
MAWLQDREDLGAGLIQRLRGRPLDCACAMQTLARRGAQDR